MNNRLLSSLLFSIAIPSAFAAPAEPYGISDALRASADERLDFVLQAQGVQIYVCKPHPKDAYAYQWAFAAPEAQLLEDGKVVGQHGAGPTWEAPDGSKVKGAVRQRQDGGSGNIPWLLLGGTAEGTGRFAGVTSVQRVATKGGVEPKDGCDQFSTGREVRVPYTADYYFYKRK